MWVIKYVGDIGFINPYSAVRDTFVVSSKFLTPSHIEGIERYLGVRGIIRHRINFDFMSEIFEATQGKILGDGKDIVSWKSKGGEITIHEKYIIKRSCLMNPVLYLLFDDESSADIGMMNHICLCRKEDIMYPKDKWEINNIDEFDKIEGYELIYKNLSLDDKKKDNYITVGFNRYEGKGQMCGLYEIFGEPEHL